MTKVTVYHAYYGCDSGCCGHVVETDDGTMRDEFRFAHPYSDHFEFARSLIREVYGDEHVKDLDWENCYISED